MKKRCKIWLSFKNCHLYNHVCVCLCVCGLCTHMKMFVCVCVFANYMQTETISSVIYCSMSYFLRHSPSLNIKFVFLASPGRQKAPRTHFLCLSRKLPCLGFMGLLETWTWVLLLLLHRKQSYTLSNLPSHSQNFSVVAPTFLTKLKIKLLFYL